MAGKIRTIKSKYESLSSIPVQETDKCSRVSLLYSSNYPNMIRQLTAIFRGYTFFVSYSSFVCASGGCELVSYGSLGVASRSGCGWMWVMVRLVWPAAVAAAGCELWFAWCGQPPLLSICRFSCTGIYKNTRYDYQDLSSIIWAYCGICSLNPSLILYDFNTTTGKLFWSTTVITCTRRWFVTSGTTYWNCYLDRLMGMILSWVHSFIPA
jgi:hypothetical protein